MGDPLKHSESSAKQFGGVADDYLHIHTVMDSSKLFLADWRHRALLHNTFGIHIFEQLLGASFTRKSDGVAVCTRTVISQHIMEDLGAIPTPGEFLREMPLKRWMAGINSKTKLRMQTLTIDGDGNKEACIPSAIEWQLTKNVLPQKENYYLVTIAGTGSVGYMKYSPTAGWSNTEGKTFKVDFIEYWAELPLHPIEL
jgi:hypothetical protein